MPARDSEHGGALEGGEIDLNLPDSETLAAIGRKDGSPLAALKSGLQQLDAQLAARFDSRTPVDNLIAARARVVGRLLEATWTRLAPTGEQLALVAVGGFGRGELHPHSDIDLMILVGQDQPGDAVISVIERFFALLWDAGLYLGHSVRTVGQCAEEAAADVVTATNLMEARLLCGDRALFNDMLRRTGADQVWPAAEFFEAKYREQQQRHHRFGDTAYNVEPNIKEGPGGLRDIQMVSWVCKRYFGEASMRGLVEHGFLTEDEYLQLRSGRLFLWQVRFALHILAGRAEDRLLFDHQRAVAERLGYEGGEGTNEAVEAFMQRYYREVMRLERLNDSLLQLFREEFLEDPELDGENLGRDFTLLNGYLGLQDEALFIRNPAAMVEMFVLLARRPDVLGVRATAIRQLRAALARLDQPLGDIEGVLAAFLRLLRQPEGVYTQLQRMNRYGVLSALLPEFGAITGRMQFDLFHVYTVDQHILFVVRNLRRFAYGKYAETYPWMAEVFREAQKPELLYLAAIFHDIAKGRGGDHSELGAADAARFCQRLDLPEGDAALVAWLVEHHLLMSRTAQRRDITDPEVVHAFALQMKHQWRLRYLYLLTVADISATSPKLWNDWKAGLLRDLYLATASVLSGDSDTAGDYESHRSNARAETVRRIQATGKTESQAQAVWQWLPPSVFLRMSPGQLAWATTEVAGHGEGPLVAIRRREDLGISEILVNAPDYTGLFASATAVFDEMGLTVLTARILTGRNARSFDLFQVMTSQGHPISKGDADILVRKLVRILDRKQLVKPVRRRMPRRLRPFAMAPSIRWDTARAGSVTAMELSCTDQPGLLSQLAARMVACEIRIHDAMIATLGDRVEDTFLVTDKDNRLLDEAQKQRFLESLRDLSHTGQVE